MKIFIDEKFPLNRIRRMNNGRIFDSELNEIVLESVRRNAWRAALSKFTKPQKCRCGNRMDFQLLPEVGYGDMPKWKCRKCGQELNGHG